MLSPFLSSLAVSPIILKIKKMNTAALEETEWGQALSSCCRATSSHFCPVCPQCGHTVRQFLSHPAALSAPKSKRKKKPC